MGAYTRQSAAQILNGEIVSATPLNAEFNKLLAAFDAASGHAHDGTSAEGPPIDRIADADQRNLILVDTSNNHLEFYVEAGGGAVQQFRLQDGAIVPITDNDIDLGTSSLEFKNAYFDGTVTTDALVADTADINGGTVDGTTIGAASASTAVVTDLTASGTINFAGATVSNGGSVTTVDINGGTINGITDLAVVDGGTGASSASDARTNLGVVIGTNVQAYDAGLADLAGLAVTNGNIAVGDGSNWVAESGATARASLGVTIGTHVQAYDADLAAIAGLTSASDKLPYFTGSGAASVTTFTAAGRALVDDADAAAQRTTLGLGTIATQSAGSVAITGGTISGISNLSDIGNALPFAFSTTTTDSDPGSGNVRLNHATQTSATAIYIDDLESNATNISALVQLLSGGNNPSSILGYITLRKEFAPEIFLQFKVTAVVNATGYTKLTIDNLSGSTASPFSNADNIFLDVGLAGDKGDTGSLSSLAVTDGNFIVGNGSTFVAESGATARTSLGLTIGTHVQAYDAGLADLAGLAVTNGNIAVGDGSNWVAESGATARTSLGLGVFATATEGQIAARVAMYS